MPSMGTGEKEPSSKRLGAQQRCMIAALGLLALLATLAFANTFYNGFAFDDERLIVKNRFIKQWRQIPTLFTTPYWAGAREGEEGAKPQGTLYRPLVLLTFALNYGLGGVNPFGYHLLNLLLHFAVSLILYNLARQLGLSWGAALIGAAVFAVHPLHTEAVTGIVGRAELVMALGVLLALLWYHRSGAPARLEVRYLLASLAAFLMALMSKEQAMVLPVLLLLADLVALKETKELRGWVGVIRGMLPRYGPYLLVLVTFLVLRVFFFEVHLYKAGAKIPFLDNPLAQAPLDVRVLTALKVAGRYLWLCVWPAQLSADYSYNAIPLAASIWDSGVLLGGLAWGGVLGLMIYAFLRGIRPVVFGLGLMVLTFLPASNLVVPIGTIMGERLFYLPSAGLCLVLGVAWERVASWTDRADHSHSLKGAALGSVTVIVLLLTLQTIQRNRDWRDTATLFRSAVRVVPQSAKAHCILGTSSLTGENLEGTLREFEEALRIYPEFLTCRWETNAALGAAFLKMRRIEEAIESLERSVRLNPNLQEAHYDLGLAYAQAERWPEAETAYRKALALNRDDFDARVSLGAALLRMGRIEEAIRTLEPAVRLKPELQEAHYDLGLAYAKAERWPEAEAAYRKALALNSGDPDTYNGLSFALRQQERWAEALAAADEAVRRKPDFVEAHFNRAQSLEALGREREAVAAYERVLSLRPGFPTVTTELQRLREGLGEKGGVLP